MALETRGEEAREPAGAGAVRLAPDEPADDAEEDVEESIQLPLDLGPPPFDANALIEAELIEREPEYGDLIDSGWIDREAHIEELDDDGSNSLDFALTLDLSDSDRDEELGQMVDLDVGALLTPLPSESENDRDAPRDGGSFESSFAVGALRDLLLPDESDAETDDGENFNDERFPAFDDAPEPTSSRIEDDGSDTEGIADEDA